MAECQVERAEGEHHAPFTRTRAQPPPRRLQAIHIPCRTLLHVQGTRQVDIYNNAAQRLRDGCIAELYILGWTHMYAPRAVWPFKKQETSRNSVEILVRQSSCTNRPRQVSNQLGEHVHVLQRLTLPTLLCTGLVSETTHISTSDPAAALDAALL